MTRIAPAIDSTALERLWHGIHELDMDFDMERSVRICHSSVLADRYLCSFLLPSLRRGRAKQLQTLLQNLNPPRQTQFPIDVLLASADYIHFGYESTGQTDVFKLYFETLGTSELLDSFAATRATIRFWALKWNPDFPNQCVISRYYAQAHELLSAALRLPAKYLSPRKSVAFVPLHRQHVSTPGSDCTD